MKYAESYQTINPPASVDYEVQGRIVEALKYAIDDALSNHRAEIFDGACEHVGRAVDREELKSLLPEALRELARTFKP
jgi:hypothetical protein